MSKDTELGENSEENESVDKTCPTAEMAMKELEETMDDLLHRRCNVELHVKDLPDKDQIQQYQGEVEEVKHQSEQTLEKAEQFRSHLAAHDRQIGIHDARIAEIDLRFQILETPSYDGILLWKIRDYNRRKQEAVSGRTLSLYSQPFYTHKYGYKMCAKVYLNGDGMGKTTHMSLFFVIMRGEYDSLLPWPFQHKVTLYLLDQGLDQNHLSDHFNPDPDSSSFGKPTTDRNVTTGSSMFVAHSVLENTENSYLKDDTIYIKLHVETANLRAL